jgi:hypothetical protein
MASIADLRGASLSGRKDVISSLFACLQVPAINFPSISLSHVPAGVYAEAARLFLLLLPQGLLGISPPMLSPGSETFGASSITTILRM